MNKLLLLLIIFSGSALGCGEYFYSRIAYGAMTNNLDDKPSYVFDAATLDLGYSWQVSKPWHVDLQLQHISRWLTGTPVNNKNERTSEHINLGLEYRWY